jgi:uncharacterized protein
MGSALSNDSGQRSPLIKLPSDMKICILSYLSDTEKLDLLYEMYTRKDKKLMHILGRWMINVQRTSLNMKTGRQFYSRDALLILLCRDPYGPNKYKKKAAPKRTSFSWFQASSMESAVDDRDDRREVERDMLTFLLSFHQIDVNICRPGGPTALVYASANGLTQIVQQLIDRGADINIMPKNGENALISACLNGHLDVATILIEHGADINAKAPKGGLSALQSCCKKGYIEIARKLIQSGVKRVTDGLNFAVHHGHHEVVEQLIKSGDVKHGKEDKMMDVVVIAAKMSRSLDEPLLRGNQADACENES